MLSGFLCLQCGKWKLFILPLAQVNFAAHQLFEGEEAEAQLAKFNRRLMGRNAIINIGIIEISGLPRDFFDPVSDF